MLGVVLWFQQPHELYTFFRFVSYKFGTQHLDVLRLKPYFQFDLNTQLIQGFI